MEVKIIDGCIKHFGCRIEVLKFDFFIKFESKEKKKL